MESFYILRLAKELQRELNKLRHELYTLCPEASLFSLEPCIILGNADNTTRIGHIPCPELPLVCEPSLRYSHHHLYLPINEAALAPLRKALGTSYPYSGIYLADVEIQHTIEPIIIKDLWFALLTIQEEGALKLWRVSSEKHLDSGKGR